MIRLASPRSSAYALLAALGLLAGLGFGRPALVALAAPAVVWLAVAWLHRPELPDVGVAADPLRLVEGETSRLEFRLHGDGRRARVELEFDLPDDVVPEAVDGRGVWDGSHRYQVAVPPGGTTVELTVRPRRWGLYAVGGLRIRTGDLLGSSQAILRLPPQTQLRVYPQIARLRTLLRPAETQLRAGDLVASGRGGGIEFATLRPYQPGDDLRRLRRRRTRHGAGWWVTDRHPERNADVVVMIDAGHALDLSDALESAVRMAAAVAAGHLGRRDRVGLVMFGGSLEWLHPQMGDRHRYRIVEALLTARAAGGLWAGIAAVPPGVLPAGATVVGLSPMIDERAIHVFADLAGRGFDVAIIETEPDVPEPVGSNEELAVRMWHLDRQAVRSRFQARGVAYASWDGGRSVAAVLDELRAFRHAVGRR